MLPAIQDKSVPVPAGSTGKSSDALAEPDLQPHLPAGCPALHPIPSQAAGPPGTDTSLVCVNRAKRPSTLTETAEEKHTDSTGIRKTLRQGRGDVLPPLHISLCRNDRLSTRALTNFLKSRDGIGTVAHPPPQKARGTARLCGAHVFFGFTFLGVAGWKEMWKPQGSGEATRDSLTEGSSLPGRAGAELGKRPFYCHEIGSRWKQGKVLTPCWCQTQQEPAVPTVPGSQSPRAGPARARVMGGPGCLWLGKA